jgi:hypothetical protein
MTIFMNVTDAVGVASNHGITRTERKRATALLGRPRFSWAGWTASEPLERLRRAAFDLLSVHKARLLDGYA